MEDSDYVYFGKLNIEGEKGGILCKVPIDTSVSGVLKLDEEVGGVKRSVVTYDMGFDDASMNVIDTAIECVIDEVTNNEGTC